MLEITAEEACNSDLQPTGWFGRPKSIQDAVAEQQGQEQEQVLVHLQKPLLHNLQHWMHLHQLLNQNVLQVGKTCLLEASTITRQTAPSTLETSAEDGNSLIMASLKRLHEDVIR